MWAHRSPRVPDSERKRHETCVMGVAVLTFSLLLLRTPLCRQSGCQRINDGRRNQKEKKKQKEERECHYQLCCCFSKRVCVSNGVPRSLFLHQGVGEGERNQIGLPAALWRDKAFWSTLTQAKKKQQLRSSSEQKRTAMKRQERKKTKKECEKVVVEEKRGKKRDVPQRNGTQKESTVTATPWGADAWEPSVFANTQEGE